MEKIFNAYETLFMLVESNIKKAVAFAEAIPASKIYPEFLIGYMKSKNGNVQDIAEMLIMKAPLSNIGYLYLVKAIVTNNEEVSRVILLLARKIEKSNLNIKDLEELASSKVYNVRQLAYTLLIMNFSDELSIEWLIKCQEIDDVELLSGARDAATNKVGSIRPIELFKLLDTKVVRVREFVKEICLLYGSDDYNFDELKKIVKEFKDPDITELAYLVIIRNFSGMLTYEELGSYRYFRNQEVRALVPGVLIERFSDRLSIEDCLGFQTSPFESVRLKSATLARKYPVGTISQNILLIEANSENELIRRLAVIILLEIPVEELDYQLLIGWYSVNSKYSHDIVGHLLRSIPVGMLDPEVIAIFLNSYDENTLSIATELALKIPSDYSKEADEFVKNHFND